MSNQARFDALAVEWDSNPTRKELGNAVADAILSAVPADGLRVLDFGAGTGLVSLRVAARAREVVAADVSPKMLEALSKKLTAGGVTNVRTVAWDADAGDCPESGFDLLVSSMALHHVRDPAAFFGRAARALLPDGTLALADLDSEDGTFHADPTGVHHQGFERPELALFAQRAGFADLAFRTAHTVSKTGPDGVTRTYDVFLMTARRV